MRRPKTFYFIFIRSSKVAGIKLINLHNIMYYRRLIEIINSTWSGSGKGKGKRRKEKAEGRGTERKRNKKSMF